MTKYTFDEMFRNPRPEDATAVASERAAGLEELELVARGLMSLDGEQPDSPALPADGALGGYAPLPNADIKENN